MSGGKQRLGRGRNRLVSAHARPIVLEIRPWFRVSVRIAAGVVIGRRAVTAGISGSHCTIRDGCRRGGFRGRPLVGGVARDAHQPVSGVVAVGGRRRRRRQLTRGRGGPLAGVAHAGPRPGPVVPERRPGAPAAVGLFLDPVQGVVDVAGGVRHAAPRTLGAQILPRTHVRQLRTDPRRLRHPHQVVVVVVGVPRRERHVGQARHVRAGPGP